MSKKENTEDIEEIVPNSDEHTEDQGQDRESEHELDDVTVEEVLREELGKEKDKFLRLFADFENYKKRTSKERMDLFKTAGQEIMVSLLPVLDDFDRALKELAKTGENELLEGVKLIRGKFGETLNSKGLEVIEAKQGDAFDAELHNAITQIPAPHKKLKGKIIDVIEKGYSLGDKIIRHPKVVVGN